MKETADAAVELAPTVERVLVVGRLSAARGPQTAGIEGRDRWWSDEMARSDHRPLTRPTPETDPETPYMIIYTSGTTGRPKGAVHVHGGFPIKGAQDLAHGFDLGPGDTPLLVHRPGLDDGPVGDQRRAAARRRAGAVRGCARLPVGRTDCGRWSPATA